MSSSIEHSAKTLEYWQATYRVRSHDNSYRWITGEARPERLMDGSILWHGYLQDIHEQEQARLTLARNEARLRGLFEFSLIGIALNDFESGQFIDLNNALLSPTGYTRDEFIALSYWDITPIDYQLEENTVEIAVRDHGPGVDPAFRSQLFQRFSQADSSDTRKLPGTGLGLAITREISQQLGGEVNYRDGLAVGGEFFIRLPREHCE